MQMVWAVIKVEIVNLIKVVQDINITMYLFLLAYLEEVELRGKARTDLVRMGLEQVVGQQVLNQVEMVEISGSSNPTNGGNGGIGAGGGGGGGLSRKGGKGGQGIICLYNHN